MSYPFRACSRVRAVPIWFMVTFWGGLCITGLGGLMAYSGIQGETGEAPRDIPQSPLLARSETGPLLMMFIHPRCPCTQASLSELERILAHCHRIPEVCLYISTPAQASEQWLESRIVRMAQKIPQAKIVADREGKLATLFGARTSGHVLLYDENGTLRYCGGITPARGHEGGTTAHHLIAAVLSGVESPPVMEGPVFGCDLGICVPEAQPLPASQEQIHDH